MSASSEQAFGTSRFEFGPATIRASAWRRYATQVGILIGWCGPGAVLAALVEGSWLVAFLAAIFALFCYLPARKRREVYVEYASLVDSRLGAFVDSMNSQAGSKEKYLEALPEQSGLLERQLRLVKPPKSLAQLHDAVA